MSGQIKCSKCGVLFDKAVNPRRKHGYYRTCQLCRDKINGLVPCKHRISAQSKPVEPEPEQTNWEAVVFGTKLESCSQLLRSTPTSNAALPMFTSGFGWAWHGKSTRR